ncbi:MAG: NAAT family transporter [Leptolyngbya sp. SIO3F4]|nr:NAAT family transporter [Leptolyngbya sp. SIO3F4]
MEQFISAATGTFLALFPITDPLGAIPVFHSLTVDSTPSHRGRQARQVACNVIAILTIALVVGRFVLDFFGISLGVLQIAGGLLLARTAWTMISASEQVEQSEKLASAIQGDITLIPLAIPLISGPGAIGMVIGLAAKSPHIAGYAGSLAGILGLGILLYLCLTLGGSLVRLLGKGGLRAFTQVLGFLILAIAIQLMSEGVFSLISDFTVALT